VNREPKVIFLHIPKTAGQSVHEYLLRNFSNELVCPARVNDQLTQYSAAELNRYQVFSGHFDWSAFDLLEGERFVFTILRDPLERLLSFYFFLREQATHFANLGQLDDKPGIKAAIELTPWQYFVDPECPLREFIDNHYDNFFTFYFAGRTYNARSKLKPLTGPGRLFADMAAVTRLAQANLATLDATLPIERWQEINPIISSVVGRNLILDDAIRVNIGKSAPTRRLGRLQTLGANDQVLRRLDEFTHWDNLLIEQTVQI
jgi:hypothetical protein